MISANKKKAPTRDNSTDAMKLRRGQEQEKGTQVNDFFSSEVNHKSRNPQNRLATEPILKQVETRELKWPNEMNRTSQEAAKLPVCDVRACFKLSGRRTLNLFKKRIRHLEMCE